jgi:hypothetical protein
LLASRVTSGDWIARIKSRSGGGHATDFRALVKTVLNRANSGVKAISKMSVKKTVVSPGLCGH